MESHDLSGRGFVSYPFKSLMIVFFVFLGLVSWIFAEPENGVRVEGQQVRVDTSTLTAVFDRAVLVSLVRKSDGKELIHSSAKDKQGVFLIYSGQEAVPLGKEETDRFTPLRINAHRADIRIEAWDGDGVMTIADDPESGDMIVEVGAYSSRPGVRACRWLLSGIDPELELVAPFFQGIRLSLEVPFIKQTHWMWPHRWEAGLAILQGEKGGLWVHCQDTRYIYKALKVGMPGDAMCLGFDTEAYGPIDNNLSAGGLAWRVNVYEGDWKVPAARYRDWLGKAYELTHVSCPQWIQDLKLALIGCPINPEVLDVLAQRIPPDKVLLHVDNLGHEQDNYPDFTPRQESADFIRKAQNMGFHVIPHCPAIDVDAKNPAYRFVQDFQYRDLENKKIIGWTWRGEGPVPESNTERIRLRQLGLRVNPRLHPALSMWRSLLSENILKLVEALSLDSIYLDVTMNTHNVYNCWVENMTPTEGMKHLQQTIRNLGNGLVLAGEGRDEINMQNQFLSIVSLFWNRFERDPNAPKTTLPFGGLPTNIFYGPEEEGVERIQPCPLGQFLFGRWSRSFGSGAVASKTPKEQSRMINLYADYGVIPTITIRSVQELRNPSPAVEEILKLATK
jgi:hypothetical protein